MATIQLKEVDGVLMLPLSPETLAELSLTADSRVEADLEGRELIVRCEGSPRRSRRSRFKLSELLADYDEIPKDPEEEYEWLNSPPVGRELL